MDTNINTTHRVIISSIVTIAYLFLAKFTGHSMLTILTVGIAVFISSYVILMPKAIYEIKYKNKLLYNLFLNPKIINSILLIGLVTILLGLIT